LRVPDSELTHERYLGIARHHKKEVLFATVLNFFSSYGQTFFISLILPAMAAAAGTTLVVAGNGYACATLLSATLLTALGHIADRFPCRKYSLLCAGILVMACLLASQVQNLVTLFLALILLRWAGQGLMPHASSVAVARFFPKRPGSAFGLSSLGFPLGEILFPGILLFLLARMDLGGIWILLASGVIFILGPVLIWTGDERKRPEKSAAAKLSGQERELVPDGRVWRDIRLYYLVPYLFAVPFVLTGILFYQSKLIEQTPWQGWMWALGMSVFATARAVVSVLGGSFLASRLALPWLAVFQIPITVGTFFLFFPGLGVGSVLLFFIGAGISMGSAMVIGKTAIVELYGTHCIGRAKAATNAIAVLSTAAAPPAMAAATNLMSGHWLLGVVGLSTLTLVTGIICTALAIPSLQKRADGI